METLSCAPNIPDPLLLRGSQLNTGLATYLPKTDSSFLLYEEISSI